jgi:predicted nucleotidyltransferase component of viral defense system
LKRKYNFDTLAKKYGFNIREIEKTCRISDLLEDISAVEFLRNRLSLYGGTAFNFIYAPNILRLSVDLDFNYRHMDTQDWGTVRDEIDGRIKDLLYRQGYSKSDISIDPSYPKCAFFIDYLNTMGIKDQFKLEIGYMRRTPILKEDATAEFKHVGTQETFSLKTPLKEELFANKWCVLLYRTTPRDLFDVYQITKIDFDYTIFRKCAIIDSLTRGKLKLYKIKAEELINNIPIDSSLKNLLQTEKINALNFNKIKQQTIKFSKTTIAQLTKDETKVIDQFFENKKFEPNLIDDKGIFHEKITEYPAILWVLKEPNA